MQDNTKSVAVKMTARRCFRTEPIYQYDVGHVLTFEGFELPTAFEVHFARSPLGKAITQIGTDGVCTVPDMFAQTAGVIYAWLYIADADSGLTKYSIEIPVAKRAQITDQEPTPVEQSAIDQAIAALNAGVEAAEDAQEAAEAAQASAESYAESAGQSAITATNAANSATSAKTAAETAARNAAASATDAHTSREAADQSATNAGISERAAASSASAAAGSATSAAASAGQASASATAASGSASTASTKASEAAQSATAAAGSAASASEDAGTASTAATAAEASATAAAGSATAAAGSATSAGQSATAAAGSAQTAQDVLDSIPADYSELSEDVNSLKSAVNEISSTDIMSHVPYSRKKYIKYSTGELTSTNNTTIRVYTLENNGFKHVHVKLYAADANSAAIAFYSTTTIGTDSYMGSASVQCSAGWHEYSALVPNGCVIIAFTHRTSDSTDTPYIKYTIVNEFNPYPDNLNNIKAHNVVRSVNHRGWHNAPENTIPAYRESKAQGFNSVECDVRFTSDDVPVLIHDETINRTARNSDGSTISETIYINSITYQEALAYDFGIYKGSGYAGTKIPTMSDFLKTCRNLGLTPYIEIEGTPSTTRFANLVEVVKQSGIAANITWISASNASLMTMMSAFPSNRYGLIPWTYSDTYRDTAKGMFNGKAEVFIDMNVSQITDTICANCAADNIPIEVWTVDNAETIQGLNSYVSGVTSNELIASVILEEAEND